LRSWYEEIAAGLEDRKKSEAVKQRALRQAQKLCIDIDVASALIEGLLAKIVPKPHEPIPKAPTDAYSKEQFIEAPTSSQEKGEYRSGSKGLGISKSSAKSFYRHLISGGAVSNDLVYLSTEKAASKSGVNERAEFLREVTNRQGTFVLFSDGDKGWVLPNPSVSYRPNALASLFPQLTREEYDEFRQNIEPVFVVRTGKGRWRVASSGNGSTSVKTKGHLASRPWSAIQTESTTFPISAADYLEQMREFGKVLRPDFQKGILVHDPSDKGEFILIQGEEMADKQQPSLLLPRVAVFQTKQEFYVYYERYYQCQKPSPGDIWIVDPALVDEVEGGWQLTKRGELEVRKPPQVEEPPHNIDGEKHEPTHHDHEPAEESEEVTTVAEPREEGENSSVPLMALLGHSHRKWLIAALMATLLIIVTLSLWPKSITPPPPPPLSPIPPNMVEVPGGKFLMGNDRGDPYEKPAHEVIVGHFYIDKYEVTCEDYAHFVKDKSYRPPPQWKNGTFPAGWAHLPVTGITWDDANAYAQWAGKRLPTEEEWEFAARGTDGRKYAWGNDWVPNAANAGSTSQHHLGNVGERSNGASPFGALDMIGNAWEWTSSKFAPYQGGSVPKGERIDPSIDFRVIRGGSWQENSDQATSTYRGGWRARGANDYLATGFRCVIPLSN
jgi:formylglycine-generating enzyme required for sulfatase activity